MLESLWLKEDLENKHVHVFFFGALFTAIAIALLIVRYVINFHSGLVAVFIA